MKTLLVTLSLALAAGASSVRAQSAVAPGAAIGAIAGSIIGGHNHDNWAEGAVLGGIAGAVIGAAVSPQYPAYQSGPVYQDAYGQPAAVYQQPVYGQPGQVVYAQPAPTVVYQSAPNVVYAPAPIYAPAPVVVYRPRYYPAPVLNFGVRFGPAPRYYGHQYERRGYGHYGHRW